MCVFCFVHVSWLSIQSIYHVLHTFLNGNYIKVSIKIRALLTRMHIHSFFRRPISNVVYLVVFFTVPTWKQLSICTQYTCTPHCPAMLQSLTTSDSQKKPSKKIWICFFSFVCRLEIITVRQCTRLLFGQLKRICFLFSSSLYDARTLN